MPGISPGVALGLMREWPAAVVRCEGTEIAFEPEAARNIHVRRRGEGRGCIGRPRYRTILRSLRALLITETELNVMAALAIIGLSSSPAKG